MGFVETLIMLQYGLYIMNYIYIIYVFLYVIMDIIVTSDRVTCWIKIKKRRVRRKKEKEKRQ